jgi:hypothetical protein
MTAMTVLQRTLLFCGIVGVVALWLIPKWQVASFDLNNMERVSAENAARQTLTQILAGIVLFVGLYFTWGNLKVAEQNIQTTQATALKNLKLAHEGQITDRFTKAISQLADEKMAVRVGGIYALERIARDSERDHWPVMEVLTSFVRERARQPSTDEKPLKKVPPAWKNCHPSQSFGWQRIFRPC